MMRRARLWLEWLTANIRWKYHRGDYGIKGWFWRMRIISANSYMSDADVLHLGGLANPHLYMATPYTANNYTDLQIGYENLKNECDAKDRLIEDMRDLIC